MQAHESTPMSHLSWHLFMQAKHGSSRGQLQEGCVPSCTNCFWKRAPGQPDTGGFLLCSVGMPVANLAENFELAQIWVAPLGVFLREESLIREQSTCVLLRQ